MPEDKEKYLLALLGIAGVGAAAYVVSRLLVPPTPPPTPAPAPAAPAPAPTPAPAAPTPAPAPPTEAVIETSPTPAGISEITSTEEYVAPPGELSIESVSLSREEVEEGESVTILVKVTNIGASPTSGAVELRANGTYIGTYGTGTLAPNESTTIVATWTPPAEGSYLIEATL